MSVYDCKSLDDAFKKMEELQYKVIDDDFCEGEQIDEVDNNQDDNNSNSKHTADEEKQLMSTTSRKSSFTLMESWLRKCGKRAATHSKLSISYGRWHKFINIPKILLGGAATALSFWATSDENGTSHEVRLVVAILAGGSSVFTTVGQFLNYKELQQDHRIASGMYSQLCRKMELNIFRPSTKSAVVGIDRFLAEIAIEFSNIVTFSPQITLQY